MSPVLRARAAFVAPLVLVLVACRPPAADRAATPHGGGEDVDSAAPDTAPPADDDTGPADTGEGDPAPSDAAVRLNELCPDNVALRDEHARTPDWIELFNPADAPMHVGGFAIADAPDPARAWQLPDGLVVPAGGFLLLWASGEDDPEGGRLPFKLSADGETVFLWDPEGRAVDAVTFAALGPGETWARDGDGEGPWERRAAGTPGASNSTPVETTATLVETGATWRYLDDGATPDAEWVTGAFDDSGWAEGAAPLGYGDPVTTTVSYGGDPNAKPISTWFRHGFHVAEGALDEAVSADVLLRVDDGALVFLNGVEVVRSNLPAGDVTADTPALSAIGGSSETAYDVWRVPTDALQEGDNVVAVEVHQAGPTSSDIVLDLGLQVTSRGEGR